jgi:hypothetical protein
MSATRERRTVSDMSKHRARVEPARVRMYDDTLGCDTLSVIGYRAHCVCGWRGKLRKERDGARIDAFHHLRRR